ncbi:hypothetical protein PG994_012793 [Apiospora phragmitis]|uniref:Cytochrome P450 n=1 Tax=Apiospora phragmitis TaxID=2905665 RepID=A0ABR1TDC6_9PEZI
MSSPVVSSNTLLGALVLFIATYVGWRWTNLWRFYHTLRGDMHLVNLRAHQKYGPVVRTGPNHLDLDLPGLIKTVYSSDGRWRKTDFYPPASNVMDGRVVDNLFSLQDPAQHARQKRPVAKHYSLAGVLSLEPYVDETIRLLCRMLEERYMPARSGGDGEGETGERFSPGFDLGQWIKMYTWDVIGQITFGKHFGYLRAGRDFDGHLWLSDKGADYLASVSQIPWLDRLIDKNPLFPVAGATALLGPTLQYLEERYAAARDDGHHNPHDDAAAAATTQPPDFLDKFLEAQREHPDVVDRRQVVGYLSINMLAGADTTAIAIKAVLYYALRTPGVWPKLVTSVRAALDDSTAEEEAVPSPYAELRAANRMPYLEAVVREALRMHPGVAMVLPRYVPADGLELPGGLGVVPPGTSVGMNPYVLGRNRGVWGPDADEFRPERWLRYGHGHGQKEEEEEAEDEETEEGYAARLRAMNNADLTFGAGSRVCLGKHLGLLQVYKVVATLVARYDLELVDPAKNWWVRCAFFLRQRGPDVRIRRRRRG